MSTLPGWAGAGMGSGPTRCLDGGGGWKAKDDHGQQRQGTVADLQQQFRWPRIKPQLDVAHAATSSSAAARRLKWRSTQVATRGLPRPPASGTYSEKDYRVRARWSVANVLAWPRLAICRPTCRAKTGAPQRRHRQLHAGCPASDGRAARRTL